MAAPVADKPKAASLFRRSLLVSLGVALFVVFSLAGLWVYQRAEDERELREAMAEADRLDPGWRLAELEEDRATIPDADNGALTVLAAAQVLPRPFLPASTFWDDRTNVTSLLTEILSPEVRLPEKQAEELWAALGKADAALQAARPLADQPRGRFAVAWSPDGLSTILPHLDETTQVANLLYFDAALKAHDGDIDGALTSALTVLNSGRAIGDEPHMASHMFRSRAQNVALRAAEKALAQGQASPAALEKAQGEFNAERKEPLVLVAMRGQRANLHLALTALAKAQVNPRIRALKSSPYVPDTVMNMVDSGKAHSMHGAAIRYLTEMVEVAKLPAEQQGEAFAKWDKPEIDYPPVLRVDINGVFSWPWSILHAQARLRCAVTALAVERFRLARGHWPDTLAELSPEWVKEPLLDPMDGAPLRYRRLEDGVVIYSVGHGAEDNGGDLDRTLSWAQDKDIGFRLWDVDRRRKAAPEPK